MAPDVGLGGLGLGADGARLTTVTDRRALSGINRAGAGWYPDSYAQP